MPSRRSDRGGSLKRQAKAAKAAQPDLEKSIERRKRWEDERDATYRVGWEEWDYLDNDTRQDLVRESAVVGGLSAVGDIITFPRKLGLNKAAKELLKSMAPHAARRILGARPRKVSEAQDGLWEQYRAEDLMGRINQVRKARMAFENLSRPAQERVNMLRKDAGKKPFSLGAREAAQRTVDRYLPTQWGKNAILDAASDREENIRIQKEIAALGRRRDDWRSKRDWTGVSREDGYFDIEGRASGEEVKGKLNLWDIPIDNWNEYFTYPFDPKKSKKESKR